MSDWLEHSEQVEVPVSIEAAWDLWSNLELMPQWMNWIDSVEILKDKPELSQWTLSGGGLTFTWLSRILKEIPNQIIQWESVDGLPNRGAIRFYDRKQDTSVVKLTVAYKIPGVVGQFMDNLFLGNVVESNLRSDLQRFREYAIQHHS
ncbi:SRPBCC family protein [Acaryochloris sp. 'Moss Beach']|uniref:SRPBCC family protein n=1 Tax=Acaryochloris TaxID=155977 RepID=UPI001BAEA6D2|nr:MULTISPECIES: SRPBCC family protein [Acaryochloris]QUY43083.1 SRPBCC family protein [Acaryochloris marina S15]UJB67960.1 SRPBCC family protein [Acaryochloris sp. 'Moss Beach']